MSKKNKSKYGDVSKYLSLIAKISTYMVSSIILFFMVGLYLDKKLHSKGIFMILGVFIGLGFGFFFVYKQIMKLDSEDK
ncbi:hypothetical protein DID75_00455 [Candidatus Marinamargulisbacteria bacterium SCGC AG-410-N11]|nr:hypothetical protein DID75_00455 [Candidatus Marinamargulisbacteria bacterium SCGC AG-410-N11]